MGTLPPARAGRLLSLTGRSGKIALTTEDTQHQPSSPTCRSHTSNPTDRPWFPPPNCSLTRNYDNNTQAHDIACLVALRVAPSSLNPHAQALYLRWSDPDSPHMTGCPDGAIRDLRGPSKRADESAQTFLKPDQAAAMVAEWEARATLKALALKYKVHAGTVASHVRKAGAVQVSRVTPEVLAELEAGVPATELAIRLNVKAEEILHCARIAGANGGPESDDTQQAVAWYADGVGVAEIAKRLGIGGGGARRLLVDAGVTIRRPGLPTQLESHKTEVMALRREGWSYRRIGERFDVGAPTVALHTNPRSVDLLCVPY